ncbi:MAG: hypothetical protein Q9225_001750 [Loekoesia sp. 1 TL-2023]
MNTTQDRVLVPSHTPKPLPDYLRSELTSALLASSTIPIIQSTLYNASRDAGWIDSVRERAKQLINSGHPMTWEEVLELLVKESQEWPISRNNMPGGLRRVRQNGDGGAGAAEPADDLVGIRFPDEAIAKGKEAVRKALEDIVEVETIGFTG